MTEPKKPRRAVDWEAMEPHYRSGLLSLKELGAQYGVSDAAIIKHAKKNNWTRSLLAKIQARADAKVSAAVVSAEVSAERALTEKQVVEANADVQVVIRLAHRKDIARSRALFAALMDELEQTTQNRELYEQLGEILNRSDEEDHTRQDRLNELFRKVISMPMRVDSAKKLVELLEKVVRLEREAFGIDKEDGKENPIDTALKAIAEMKRNGIRPDA